MEKFVDISGTELKVGDKVAVQYQQLFRIGQIIGFTKKKIIVTFDFGGMGESLENAKLDSWRMAKVVNQNVGLKDYYQYINNNNNN